MKRFQEYITEQSQRDTQIDQLVQNIARDCRPFLDEIDFGLNTNPLYRGMESSMGYGKIQVKKNRKPRDTPEVIHDAVDFEFKEIFGFRARSETFMATGTPRVAAQYGSIFVVFPIGNIDYVWSPEIPDFTSNKLIELLLDELSKMNSDFKREISGRNYLYYQNFEVFAYIYGEDPDELYDGQPLRMQYGEKLAQYFDDMDIDEAFSNVIRNNYQANNGLKRIVDEELDNEIMIKCDEYYAVKYDVWKSEDMQRKLFNAYMDRYYKLEET